MAAEMCFSVYEWFWSKSFWLPTNVTWKDLESDENNYYAAPFDLFYPIPLAVFMFIIRLVWERFVATPVGRYFSLREVLPRAPIANATLDEAYRKYRRITPDHDVVLGLSKQCDFTPRQVERWFRRRRFQGKPSEMQRFRETSWRFIYYFVIFWYGVAVLWNKEWLWDTKNCWYGYPKQHVPNDIYWYYMIVLGFYWSLVLSLFMDVKRKDFAEMIIHHIATISLMMLSWANNMVRVGTLVVLVHDAVDYWLEGAKLAKYMKYHKLCDALFVVFTSMWFITRLVIYPFWVLNSTMVEAYTMLEHFPVYYMFNTLLLVLQILHIIWFYMILGMVHQFVFKGQTKDSRSDTEPETNSEDEPIIANGKLPASSKLLNGNNNFKSSRKPAKKSK